MRENIYLYVTPYFPAPDDWRGAYCLDFVRALSKVLNALRSHWRIEVFVPRSRGDYDIDGIRVHTFRTYGLPGDVVPFFYRRKNTRSFLHAVTRAGVDIDNVRVCHCNNVPRAIYGIALKQLNPAIIALVHHHDLASFGINFGRLRYQWAYKLYLYFKVRRLIESVDWHVFISERCKQSCMSFPDTSWTSYKPYERLGRGLKWLRKARIRRAYVLHNGVDLEVFRQVDRKPHAGFVIGCVGNFEILKDQMSLLRAVKSIEGQVRIIFIGSGPELESCRRYASEQGIDAEFRTEVRHHELPAFFGEIDLFVLPSYFEGFGCVYTEAWACGVPFIACEGQGVEDLIPQEDRHLWLAKACDPVDLANKIQYYMKHRTTQRLNETVDINELVRRFVTAIGLDNIE